MHSSTNRTQLDNKTRARLLVIYWSVIINNLSRGEGKIQFHCVKTKGWSQGARGVKKQWGQKEGKINMINRGEGNRASLRERLLEESERDF